MLETHPHVKYIRVCDTRNSLGYKVQTLIIDTDLQVEKNTDLRLVELAANIREFEQSCKKGLGLFGAIEVYGKMPEHPEKKKYSHLKID